MKLLLLHVIMLNIIVNTFKVVPFKVLIKVIKNINDTVVKRMRNGRYVYV